MLQESKIKVSVILPVYNPGPMISKCIETLRNQTLKEIEIIFVDDCSTDSSMDKVRQVAAEDSRIKILTNEKNSGAGFSRNRGIEIACGEYLSFVDPDDYVALDFLELLYNKAKETNADIAKGVRIPIKEDGAIGRQSNLNKYISDSIKENKPLYVYFTKEHQSAIYKREMIIQNSIRYGSSQKKQDQTFLLKVTSQVQAFAMEDRAVYYFCERASSAMHTVNFAHLAETVLSLKERIDYLLKNLLNDSYIVVYIKNLVAEIFDDIKYAENISELNEHINFFENQIKEQLYRLPFLEELKNNSMSIKIFMEKNIYIPTFVRKLDWENYNYEAYLNLMNKWIQFYQENQDYSPDRTIHWIKEMGKTALNIGIQQNKEKEVRKKIKYLLSPLNRKTGRKIMKAL